MWSSYIYKVKSDEMKVRKKKKIAMEKMGMETVKVWKKKF